MLYRINILLACLLVLVVAMLAFSRVDHSRPNYQIVIGDDMTYSPGYSSYSKNSNFANGRTLQDPVPGTIARGEQVFHFKATPEDAIRAGEELTNPFALKEDSKEAEEKTDPTDSEAVASQPIDLSAMEHTASVDRGAATFKTFCISCHAADGTGNGPVAKRGFPPPPSLLIGKSRQMKDGQLFHILTYGQNSMPQFAAQLSPERRWDVINHIRRLQQDAPPLPDVIEETPAPEVDQEAATEEETAETPVVEQEPVPESETEAASEVEQETTPEEKQESAPEVEQDPPATTETSQDTQPDSESPAQVDTETKP